MLTIVDMDAAHVAARVGEAEERGRIQGIALGTAPHFYPRYVPTIITGDTITPEARDGK